MVTMNNISFSALTLLAGWQEGHMAHNLSLIPQRFSSRTSRGRKLDGRTG